jgi:pyrimidine deaminase RibD-like protein
MERAIKLARRCKSEPGMVSPKVGAVVPRDGLVIFTTGSTDEPR